MDETSTSVLAKHRGGAVRLRSRTPNPVLRREDAADAARATRGEAGVVLAIGAIFLVFVVGVAASSLGRESEGVWMILFSAPQIPQFPNLSALEILAGNVGAGGEKAKKPSSKKSFRDSHPGHKTRRIS